VWAKRAGADDRLATLARGAVQESPPGPVTGPVRGSERKGRNMVFVLDKRKKPLMPCSEKRARLFNPFTGTDFASTDECIEFLKLVMGADDSQIEIIPQS